MNDVITLIANVSLALSFLIGLVFRIAQVKAAEHMTERQAVNPRVPFYKNRS